MAASTIHQHMGELFLHRYCRLNRQVYTCSACIDTKDKPSTAPHLPSAPSTAPRHPNCPHLLLHARLSLACSREEAQPGSPLTAGAAVSAAPHAGAAHHDSCCRIHGSHWVHQTCRAPKSLASHPVSCVLHQRHHAQSCSSPPSRAGCAFGSSGPCLRLAPP